MKNILRTTLALSFLSLPTFASTTSALPLGCGYSDFVFQEIARITGQKAQVNAGLQSHQGETGRRFLLYADHSWVVTFEYFSPVDTARDVSCIVKTGDENPIDEGMDYRPTSLPSQRLGAPLAPEDEARLVLQTPQ